MANSFHTCLYLLWSIPYFRFVLRRAYILEAECLKVSGRLLTSAICFKLSRIVHLMDDLKSKPTYIADAWSAFTKQFENYRTHTIIDATDLLSDILGVLHTSLSLPGIWYKPSKSTTPLTERVESIVSPRQHSSIVNSSPIFAAIGGEIEKNFLCKECSNTTHRVENFISLNFKKLHEPEISEIRGQFEKQGYREGLVYRSDTRKKGLLSRVFQRKQKQTPVVTIRDYFCHLNLLQRERLEEYCAHCGRRCAMEATLTLSKAPAILQIGLSGGEDPQPGAELDFQLDLEFDPEVFFKHSAPKYRLQAVVSVEEGILGIVHYATCFRDGSDDGWLKTNL